MQISSNGCCGNPERNFGRKLTEKKSLDNVQDKSLYTMRDITGNNVGDRIPGSNFDRYLRTDRNIPEEGNVKSPGETLEESLRKYFYLLRALGNSRHADVVFAQRA